MWFFCWYKVNYFAAITATFLANINIYYLYIIYKTKNKLKNNSNYNNKVLYKNKIVYFIIKNFCLKYNSYNSRYNCYKCNKYKYTNSKNNK